MSEKGPEIPKIEIAPIRERIDKCKELIKNEAVFDMNKSQEERKTAAELVLSGMEMKSKTLNEVRDNLQNGTVSEEGIRKNISELGIAIGEVVLESDNEELKLAAMAGSYSLEALLPEPWQGRIETDSGDVGLAGVVCESIGGMNGIRKERKEIITGVMESVDFMKNNGFEYQGQVEDGIVELNKLLRTSLSSGEKRILADRLKYMQSQKVSLGHQESGPLEQAAEKISVAAEKMAETVSNMNETKKEKEDNDEDINDKDGKKPDKKNRTRSGIDLDYREIPIDPDELLKYAEERLNIIENYKTKSIKGELALGDFTYPLFTLLSQDKNPEHEHVLNIINTRLTLREIGGRMQANSGSMDDHNGMVRCIADLESDGFDMSPQVMEYFFKNKIDGLKTAQAWDLMEKSNFSYVEMCNEALINGSEKIKKMIENAGGKENFLKFSDLPSTKGTWLEGQVRNYYLDTCGNESRATILKEYLVEKLMKENGLDDYHARKSMQLAEFMYDASMESCVVDWDFINGDEYAEAVNIGYIRILDGAYGNKGKMTGPRISIRKVDHLTPGWIRDFAGVRTPEKAILAEDILKGLNGKGVDNKTGGLSGKKLYASHFISIISKKIWPTRSFLLNEETPLTKDVLKTQYFQKVNDCFNKVDSQIGKKGTTKTAWLAGLIELTFTGRDSTWTKDDLKQLKRIVTQDVISNEDNEGKGDTFVTLKQWEWIENALNYNKQVGRLNRMNIIEGFLSGKKR